VQSTRLTSFTSADVKASCGTLSKPIFPIPWHIESLSPQILSRISPSLDFPLYYLATAFPQIPILSPKIVSLFFNLRDLAYLDDWNARDAQSLSAAEHELFRIKAQEIEHQLLSYPYDAVNLERESSEKASILPSDRFHPLEMITRIAALLYVNNVIAVSLPAFGLMRALIFHFKRQLQQLQYQLETRPPPPAALDLLAWVLFLGAQSSQGQVERPWFVRHIAGLVQVKGWEDWAAVERVMQTFLYVERVSGACWREIWQEVERVSEDEEWEVEDE
jgi:hypothetical protein